METSVGKKEKASNANEAEIADGMPIQQQEQQQMMYDREEIVTQQQVGVMRGGYDLLCYSEGCQNSGSLRCRLVFCCADVGCGRSMCEEHASAKKCWPGSPGCGCCQRVCLDHEAKAKKRSYIGIAFILLLALLCILFEITVHFVFSDDSNDQDKE